MPAPRPHRADLPAASGAASAAAAYAARYCYNGSAFRYQPGSADSAHPREFRQAGIELFAAADREQDDAAVLALIVAGAARRRASSASSCSLGDLGLFDALLDALPMPERWRAAAAATSSGGPRRSAPSWCA